MIEKRPKMHIVNSRINESRCAHSGVLLSFKKNSLHRKREYTNVHFYVLMYLRKMEKVNKKVRWVI